MTRHTLATRLISLSLIAAAASFVACGDDEAPIAPDARLRVTLFGWGPDDQGQTTFVQGMPAYPGAASVRARLTQPVQSRLIEQNVGPIADRAIKLPELPFGRQLRMELDVLDAQGQVLATGATPTFDFEEGDLARAFRMMVLPSDTFAPAGSIVVGDDGTRQFLQSRLDYRAEFTRSSDAQNAWLGRTGHASAPLSDGRVLIVGGADVVPGTEPGSIPRFRRVYRDLQVFDPETGYFTDLSFDEDANAPFQTEAELLTDERAFHTVTPIGEDRFVVAGGYRTFAEQTRPVETLELIDMRAPAGERVRPIMDQNGQGQLRLTGARGFHESVYFEQTAQLLLIGGIGTSSEDILDTIEIIDVAGQRVIGQPFPMVSPRAGHEAVVLGDGRVWILGGRSMQGALRSTEIVSIGPTGLVSEEGPTMRTARYDFGAALLDNDGGQSVIALGGFTSLDAGASNTFEVGVPQASDFVQQPSWQLGQARGGHDVLKLPQTRDLLILGGRGDSGRTIGAPERVSIDAGAGTATVTSEGLGQPVVPRYGATYTLMTSGQILVFGGVGQRGGQVAALDSAEVYNARDPISTSAPIATTP